MRLPGASVSLHRRRLCTNGLCCHLLTLSRLWDHYWYCDLRPYRPQRDIGNNLLNYSTTVLCIYIRPSFHPVSDSHQPSEMETSSRHDCHRFRRLRCQLLFRPTVLLQRPSSQHPWGLHRGRPWQSVLSPPARRCGRRSSSRHFRASPLWLGGQRLSRQRCHFCQSTHTQCHGSHNDQQRDAGRFGGLY